MGSAQSPFVAVDVAPESLATLSLSTSATTENPKIKKTDVHSMTLKRSYTLKSGEVTTEAQIHQLHHLLRQFKPAPIDDMEIFTQNIQRAKKNNQIIYYLSAEDVIVGALKAFFYSSPLMGKTVYFGGLIIDKEYRNSNVLQTLISIMEQQAIAAKVKCATFGRSIQPVERDRYVKKHGYKNQFTAYYRRSPSDFLILPLDNDMQPKEAKTSEEFQRLIPLLQQQAPQLQDNLDALENFAQSRKDNHSLHYIEYKKQMVGVICVHLFFDANWGYVDILRNCCVANHPEAARITLNLFKHYRNISHNNGTISEEVNLFGDTQQFLEELARKADYERAFNYYVKSYA